MSYIVCLTRLLSIPDIEFGEGDLFTKAASATFDVHTRAKFLDTLMEVHGGRKYRYIEVHGSTWR